VNVGVGVGDLGTRAFVRVGVGDLVVWTFVSSGFGVFVGGWRGDNSTTVVIVGICVRKAVLEGRATALWQEESIAASMINVANMMKIIMRFIGLPSIQYVY